MGRAKREFKMDEQGIVFWFCKGHREWETADNFYSNGNGGYQSSCKDVIRIRNSAKRGVAALENEGRVREQRIRLDEWLRGLPDNSKAVWYKLLSVADKDEDTQHQALVEAHGSASIKKQAKDNHWPSLWGPNYGEPLEHKTLRDFLDSDHFRNPNPFSGMPEGNSDDGTTT
jgi:hypothetical protein